MLAEAADAFDEIGEAEQATIDSAFGNDFVKLFGNAFIGTADRRNAHERAMTVRRRSREAGQMVF
jgi:hypothetical protein